MKKQRALCALIVAVAASTTACGSSDPSTSSTIEVAMKDNSFAPGTFTVEAGQEVTFRFRNKGAVRHEAIIGTEAEQTDHETQMADQQANPGGMDDVGHEDMGHDDPASGMSGATVVEPGAIGTLTERFTRPGTIILGCHQPGHYASGMLATITVT